MHQWEEAKAKINLIFQNNVNKYFFLKTLSMIVIFPLILQKRITHIGFVYWLTNKQTMVSGTGSDYSVFVTFLALGLVSGGSE